jgi:hypothetical protein
VLKIIKFAPLLLVPERHRDEEVDNSGKQILTYRL